MSLFVKDLSVAYNKKTVLDGLSCEFQAGQFSIIVGPNGSGKSTLIKALAGEQRYAGRIVIEGQDQQKIPNWKLATMRGVVPQSVQVSVPFTVREIVEIGLSASPTRIKHPHRWHDALEECGLQGFENLYYHELSGGEQQRVQLARVRCQIWEPVYEDVPRWFILDEPVSSLDIRHQIQVMDIAKRFAAGGGGVIAVMHDLNLSAMYSDRMILLNNGEIYDNGEAQQVVSSDNLNTVYHQGWEVNIREDKKIPYVLPQIRN